MLSSLFRALFNRLGTRVINGAFTTTTSGAISTGGSGKGWTSLARSNTGEYTMVLDTPVSELVSANFSIGHGTPADYTIELKSWTLATRTLIFMINKAGTATDTSGHIGYFSIAVRASDTP